jgi:hypothetical protein
VSGRHLVLSVALLNASQAASVPSVAPSAATVGGVALDDSEARVRDALGAPTGRERRHDTMADAPAMTLHQGSDACVAADMIQRLGWEPVQ